MVRVLAVLVLVALMGTPISGQEKFWTVDYNKMLLSIGPIDYIPLQFSRHGDHKPVITVRGLASGWQVAIDQETCLAAPTTERGTTWTCNVNGALAGGAVYPVDGAAAITVAVKGRYTEVWAAPWCTSLTVRRHEATRLEVTRYVSCERGQP